MAYQFITKLLIFDKSAADGLRMNVDVSKVRKLIIPRILAVAETQNVQRVRPSSSPVPM